MTNKRKILRIFTSGIFLVLVLSFGSVYAEFPEDPYMKLGNEYMKQGRYDEAAQEYTKAIQAAPRVKECYFNRGNANFRKGLYDNAIADYTSAISINSRYAAAYCGRGAAYAKKGLYDNALADFAKASMMDTWPRKNEAIARYNCARIYAEWGQYDKAWEDVKIAQKYGYHVEEEFLDDLRRASGRDE